MKTEIIERRGKQFAVVPLEKFEHLVRDAEMLEDIRAYDVAKGRKEEAFPAEVADRLIAGEPPIRVFREYRGLTQAQLAKAADITAPYLAELESAKKTGSLVVLRAIATALNVGVGDLAD